MVDEIRVARAADVPGVEACVRAAYTPYIARIGMEPGPLLDDYAALVAGGGIRVLAEGDAIAGLIVTESQADCLLLANIAVAPAFQGRGLGRRLMAAVEDLAREGGQDAICLYTHELMTENLALYARWGFVETARREEHGFRRVFMRKALAGSPRPE